MHMRTSLGTFHRLIFYTGLSSSDFKMQDGNDATPEINIRTQGTGAATAHGIMLTHRVMRNTWYLLDFLIKAKT